MRSLFLVECFSHDPEAGGEAAADEARGVAVVPGVRLEQDPTRPCQRVSRAAPSRSSTNPGMVSAQPLG
jgi:hypothetical protein